MDFVDHKHIHIVCWLRMHTNTPAVGPRGVEVRDLPYSTAPERMGTDKLKYVVPVSNYQKRRLGVFHMISQVGKKFFRVPFFQLFLRFRLGSGERNASQAVVELLPKVVDIPPFKRDNDFPSSGKVRFITIVVKDGGIMGHVLLFMQDFVEFGMLVLAVSLLVQHFQKGFANEWIEDSEVYDHVACKKSSHGESRTCVFQKPSTVFSNTLQIRVRSRPIELDDCFLVMPSITADGMGDTRYTEVQTLLGLLSQSIDFAAHPVVNYVKRPSRTRDIIACFAQLKLALQLLTLLAILNLCFIHMIERAEHIDIMLFRVATLDFMSISFGLGHRLGWRL